MIFMDVLWPLHTFPISNFQFTPPPSLMATAFFNISGCLLLVGELLVYFDDFWAMITHLESKVFTFNIRFKLDSFNFIIPNMIYILVNTLYLNDFINMSIS